MQYKIMHTLKSMQAGLQEMQILNLEPRKNGQKVNLESSSVVGMAKNRELQHTTQVLKQIHKKLLKNTARINGKI